MSDKGTDKYFVGDCWSEWKNVSIAVTHAESRYRENVCKHRDDITGRQAKDEFWERIAEFYGFEIKWNRET